MSVWKNLTEIDCGPFIEQKNGLNYLSWAHAWSALMERYEGASFEVLPLETFADGTVMVHVAVTIENVTRKMWLPVMDNRNRSISNPSSFQVNTAIMRCLTKCLALFGLGTYIYRGEDISPAEQDRLEKPLTHDQYVEISDLLAETDTDLTKFCSVYKIETVPDLPQKFYENARAALEKKLQKMEADRASD